MKNKWNLFYLACSLALVSSKSHAGLDDFMKDAFDSLANTTNASSVDNARRGIHTGGDIFIKNRSRSYNLVSASAPKVEAGCNGISIHGGSFSYLNAKQFGKVFKDIGSNALGYGLQYAMKNMCEPCMNLMSSLQKSAELINGINMDSCRAAEGIVEMIGDKVKGKELDLATKMEGVEDWFSDFGEAWNWSESTSESPNKNIKDAGKEDDFSGNIIWKSIKKGGMASVFSAPGASNFDEMIMSLTGTAIYGINSADQGEFTFKPRLLKLEHLITGSLGANGDIPMYKCDTNTEEGCLKPTERGVFEFPGFHEQVVGMYLDSDGYINGLYDNKPYSEKAKKALSLPGTVAGICNMHIENAIVLGKTDGKIIAKHFASLCAYRVSIELAYLMALEYIDGADRLLSEVKAETAMINSQSLKEVKESIAKVRIELNQEYHKLIINVDVEELLDVMRTYIKSLPRAKTFQK